MNVLLLGNELDVAVAEQDVFAAGAVVVVGIGIIVVGANERNIGFFDQPDFGR